MTPTTKAEPLLALPLLIKGNRVLYFLSFLRKLEKPINNELKRRTNASIADDLLNPSAVVEMKHPALPPPPPPSPAATAPAPLGSMIILVWNGGNMACLTAFKVSSAFLMSLPLMKKQVCLKALGLLENMASCVRLVASRGVTFS